MKTFFAAAGAILLVLLLGVIGLVGYSAYTGNQLDASSKAYVDETLPPIISTWSKQELIKRASPPLLDIIKAHPEQLDQLFEKLTKLGPLRNYGGCKGDSNISYTTQNGKVVTASYKAVATFQNGKADIVVRLVQVSGQWEYLLFNVNSPIFLQ